MSENRDLYGYHTNLSPDAQRDASVTRSDDYSTALSKVHNHQKAQYDAFMKNITPATNAPQASRPMTAAEIERMEAVWRRVGNGIASLARYALWLARWFIVYFPTWIPYSVVNHHFDNWFGWQHYEIRKFILIGLWLAGMGWFVYQCVLTPGRIRRYTQAKKARRAS